MEPAAEKPAVVASVPPEVRERLMASALTARENNTSDEFMSADNLRWFVGSENVANHSHVLILGQRGQDVRQVYIATSTFTPDLVGRAINDIHGALQ